MSDRAEFDRWVGVYVTRAAPLRATGVRAPIYDPSIGGPEVQALVSDPTNPAVLPALDGAIYASQGRLIYLRRMLDATDAVAAALSTN